MATAHDTDGGTLLATLVRVAEADTPDIQPRHFLSFAAQIFEKARALDRGLTRAEQDRYAWMGEVVVAELTTEGVARLRAALIARVRRQPDAGCTGAALWALSKWFDPALRDFFLDALEALVALESPMLFSAMLALDDLGERPFGDRADREVLDSSETAQNLADARRYLARVRG